MKNIGESFSFVFKDPNWLTKIIIGGLFSFLSIFLIGIPVLYGYNIELLQRIRRGEQYPLPEWKDVGVKFITGIKYIVTFIVYYLPIIILMIPVAFIIILTSIQGLYSHAFIGSATMITIVIFVIVPYSLIIFLVTPIISILFADKESIGDGLQIGAVINLFKKCWEDIIIVALVSLALDILSCLGIIFFLIGIFLTSFYVSVVKFHLYGQIANSLSKS